MNTRKLTTKIIAGLLTLAILLTGISLDGAMTTANAATTYEQLKDGTTVTMKVGETKRFLVTDANGNDLIPQMRWKVSDKNILSVGDNFVDPTRDLTEYLLFTANAEGTVTVRGRRNAEAQIDKYNGFERESCPGDINVTVTVTKAATKMTAKQKKCKHVYKVTRKATCQRVGEKVCKKCKLHKSIKKTDHKWKTITKKVPVVKDILFEVWAIVYDVDTTPPYKTVKLSDYATAEEIAHAHFTETLPDPFTVVYDIVGMPESAKDAKNAFLKTVSSTLPKPVYGMREVYGEELTTETVKTCDYCGIEKK